MVDGLGKQDCQKGVRPGDSVIVATYDRYGSCEKSHYVKSNLSKRGSAPCISSQPCTAKAPVT